MEKKPETPIINTPISNSPPDQLVDPQTEVPSQNRSKHNVSNVILVIVILVVAIGSLLGYLYYQNLRSQSATPTVIQPEISPSPEMNEIGAWQTYANSTYQYAIDYPADWEVREFPDSRSGAAFRPADLPDDYQYEYISINKYGRMMIEDLPNPSFLEYVKRAGAEIQNYNSLATIQTVVTDSGITGYTATWNTTSLGSGVAGESLPRTYFELPGNSMATIQVVLDNEEYQDVYQQMVASFHYLTPVASAPVTPTASSQPVVDEKTIVSTAIKQAIATKHNSDVSTLTVAVSLIDGNYAKGSVSDAMSGGMWFAAKVNGEWQLVSDGNGVILCADVEPYPDFPTSMIPECWNESTQELVER